MREKQLHADPSLQEEMGMNWDRQWCQMMLSFVKTMAKESLEYWNNFVRCYQSAFASCSLTESFLLSIH